MLLKFIKIKQKIKKLKIYILCFFKMINVTSSGCLTSSFSLGKSTEEESNSSINEKISKQPIDDVEEGISTKYKLNCPRKSITYAIILSLIFVIIIVITIPIIISKKKHKSQNNIIDNGEWLNNLLPLNSSWNIKTYYYGKEYVEKINDQIIKVNYPQLSYEDNGGFKFYAEPNIFPINKVCFSYIIEFAKNFDFVKGGKLPGLYMGNKGANGGNTLSDSSSIRIMWRANGNTEAYIYLPDQVDILFNSSDVKYNNEYGISFWRGQFGKLKLRSNKIDLCLKINTFTNNQANYDGILKITINNITKSYDKFIFVTQESYSITGLFMNTFFGGNDISWATPVDTYIYFKNFTLSDFGI